MTLAVTLPATLLVIALLHFWLGNKDKRRLSYTLHIQGRTEESETMDFGVQLFEDETLLQWREKIYRAFSIQEERRAYQNQRMQELYAKAKAEAEKAKAEEKQKLGLVKPS